MLNAFGGALRKQLNLPSPACKRPHMSTLLCVLCPHPRRRCWNGVNCISPPIYLTLRSWAEYRDSFLSPLNWFASLWSELSSLLVYIFIFSFSLFFQTFSYNSIFNNNHVPGELLPNVLVTGNIYSAVPILRWIPEEMQQWTWICNTFPPLT